MEKKTKRINYYILTIFISILAVDFAAYMQISKIILIKLQSHMFIIPTLVGFAFGMLLVIIHIYYQENREMKHFKDIALRDTLTGALSRTAGRLLLSEQHARFSRNKEPYSILMIDVDHFKNVNDTYGHDIGDKVLIGIVKTLIENFRKTDHVSRWGGEEFLVVLEKTSLDQAKMVAEKLKRAIEETEFPDTGKVTVSIGISTVDDTHEDYTTLIKKADEALYRAKKSGRNRVEVA